MKNKMKKVLKNYRFTIILKRRSMIIVGVVEGPDIPSVRNYVEGIGFSVGKNAKEVSIAVC